MTRFLTHLICARCSLEHQAGLPQSVCTRCGAPLLAMYDLAAARRALSLADLAGRPWTLWRYAELLPVENPAHRITLGEGGTPLLSLPRLGQALGTPIAVALSSLLFGAVHAFNPNATVLGIANIVVVGVLLACAYLVTRSLWLPVGLHIGWNLVEIQVLGFPGSGHTEPSLLRSITSGPDLMTGGAFGPEGGLVALGAALVGIAVLLIGYRVTTGRNSR